MHRPNVRRVATLLVPALALSACTGLGGRSGEPSQAVPVARVEQQALPPVGAAPAGQPQAQPSAQPVTQGQPAALVPGGNRPGAIGGQPVAVAPSGGGFTPMTTTTLVGTWSALDRGGTSQCRLLLAAPVGGAPGDATPSGCVSEQLFRVARWQSRGDEVVLLDERNGPLVMMRPVSRDRYEGLGPGNERFAIWR
jgi:hypothetical protein